LTDIDLAQFATVAVFVYDGATAEFGSDQNREGTRGWSEPAHDAVGILDRGDEFNHLAGCGRPQVSGPGY
jgi:hypothetical protein